MTRVYSFQENRIIIFTAMDGGVYGSLTRQRVFLIIILIYNRWNGEGMRKCSALLEVFSFVRYHVLMHVLLPWNDGNCLLMEKNEI